MEIYVEFNIKLIASRNSCFGTVRRGSIKSHLLPNNFKIIFMGTFVNSETTSKETRL